MDSHTGVLPNQPSATISWGRRSLGPGNSRTGTLRSSMRATEVFLSHPYFFLVATCVSETILHWGHSAARTAEVTNVAVRASSLFD